MENRESATTSSCDCIYFMKRCTIVLNGNMEDAPWKKLFGQESEGGGVVCGRDDTRRRTGSTRGMVDGIRMRSVQGFTLRRDVTSFQSSMSSLEDRIDEKVSSVCRISSVDTERSSSSGINWKPVEPNINSQGAILEGIPLQSELVELHSQFMELKMKNCQLEEKKVNLVSTVNEFEMANMNLESKLKDEQLTVTAILQ